MAYKVIILYQLYMPSYFLGTFTEYPRFQGVQKFQKLTVVTENVLIIRSMPPAAVKRRYRGHRFDKPIALLVIPVLF